MARMHQRPIDGPADEHHVVDKRHQTGLLTRFVPEGFKHTAFYRLFLRLTRVLQFLSSIISLGIFSQRLYKVYRLVNTVKTRRGVNGSYGAVEGILAAAVLYTLITMILSLIKRNSSPGSKALRWVWVVLDVLFVGAFIAVAVLTSPKGGNAGPRRCYSVSNVSTTNPTGQIRDSTDDSCNLPWGTFILAIISTLLHAITAAFHEVRDHVEHRHTVEEEKVVHLGHNGHNGAAPLTTSDERAMHQGHNSHNGHNGAAPLTTSHNRY